MGNLGIPELLLIAAVALLVMGPRRLPEFGRHLRRAIASAREAFNESKRDTRD